MSNQEPEEINSSNGAAGLLANTDQHVGKRLKFYRERASLTAGQVAKSLDLPEAQIRALEAGAEHANAAWLFELGRVLNVPVASFFIFDDAVI